MDISKCLTLIYIYKTSCVILIKKTFLFCLVRLLQLSMNILMVIFFIVHQETMFQNCVKIHASSNSWRFGECLL